VDALTSLLEPLMIVVLGGAVGAMVICLYLPMFTLTPWSTKASDFALKKRKTGYRTGADCRKSYQSQCSADPLGAGRPCREVAQVTGLMTRNRWLAPETNKKGTKCSSTSRSGARTRRASRLIELMVVVLIMGILMAIAIPTFLSTQGSATTRRRSLTLQRLYR